MSKHQKFSRTAIVIALSAVYPVAGAYAEEDVQALTSPDKAEIAVKIPYIDKINPLYRQYNGVNHEGVNGNFDASLVRRAEDGTWFKVKAQDLGLTTVEFGTSFGKQGDWSLGFDYNQIPRYAPYDVQTAVRGAGTNVVTQPNVTLTGGVPTSPALTPLTLKTERDIIGLTGSKYLMDGVKLNFSFKNEDKTGTSMASVAGASYNGTTVANRYSRFLFAPVPINQNHKQFEFSVDYLTQQFQLQAGYYGSFLNTRDNSLTVVPGTNTALTTQTAANTLSPIALAPDNSSQQLYVNGAYNFSKDTRANFKVAYSEGRQNDGFFGGFVAGNQPLASAGSSLNGKVSTTEASAAVTSRITRDLRLLGSWRYEDKNDNTPRRAFYTAGDTNNPESHTANKGKFEADYNFGSGYAMTAGLDYMDKKSQQWERNKISEWTGRVNFRKSMGETLNGNLMFAYSDRTGSDWGATRPEIYPVYLANRTRNKIRGMLDWAPTEKLNLQAAYEGYFDDYNRSTFGLDKGNGQVVSLDGNYAIDDNWKLNAWYSWQAGEAKQYMAGAVCSTGGAAVCALNTARRPTGTTVDYFVDWDAKLKTRSEQFGVGVNGKVNLFALGGSYLYSKDTGSQHINMAAGANPGFTCTTESAAGACTVWTPIAAGNGVLPDTKYNLQTVKLYGTYSVSNATKVRLDYIYDYRKMDDYTWTNWVFADGTRVNVKPTQTTQLIGLTLIQSF